MSTPLRRLSGNRHGRTAREARSAASAMSSESPAVCSGVACLRFCSNLSIFFSFSAPLIVLARADPPQKMGVATAPGEMALTRIP